MRKIEIAQGGDEPIDSIQSSARVIRLADLKGGDGMIHDLGDNLVFDINEQRQIEEQIKQNKLKQLGHFMMLGHGIAQHKNILEQQRKRAEARGKFD